MVTHNCLRLQFQNIWHPHTDTHVGNTNKHKIKINKSKTKTKAQHPKLLYAEYVVFPNLVSLSVSVSLSTSLFHSLLETRRKRQYKVGEAFTNTKHADTHNICGYIISACHFRKANTE